MPTICRKENPNKAVIMPILSIIYPPTKVSTILGAAARENNKLNYVSLISHFSKI